MRVLYGLVLLSLGAPYAALSQSGKPASMPGMQRANPQAKQPQAPRVEQPEAPRVKQPEEPQAKQPKAAPEPCVENMPGMVMCPKAAPASPNGPLGTSSPARPARARATDNQAQDQAQDMAVKPANGPAMNSPMDKGAMALMKQMNPETFLEEIQHHSSSGTSAEPDSTPAPMLMSMKGPWMLMLHGNAFVTETQQTGPRGADKLFSTNWVMGMAERKAGPGQLTLRAMLSLEPATITGRRYPLLFQQGETAFDVPIVDGQHPHDFFMELAALYDLKLSQRTLLSFYAAPMGDPAIGPTAYPHRASASENPVGTLGHHQEDSTHIAADVVTVGLTHRIVRLEASGFHGREPDEFRWDVNSGALDSWAARVTVQPGKNWSGQGSYARIKSPEALFPGEDQARTTASVMYNRPFAGGNWASTALWGRTRSLADSSKENSYLLESLVRFGTRNYLWTRLENAGRSNELLNGERPLPAAFREEPLAHVQAYTFGYDRDVDFIPHVRSAVGAQVTAYGVPGVLQGVYGTRPVGVNLFVRFRPYSGKER